MLWLTSFDLRTSSSHSHNLFFRVVRDRWIAVELDALDGTWPVRTFAFRSTLTRSLGSLRVCLSSRGQFRTWWQGKREQKPNQS